MSYQPRYRETVNIGTSLTESSDVSSLLQSVESDLKRYQQSVTIIGTSEDDLSIREELVEIRNLIKNKLFTARNNISQQQERANARDRVALNKLSKQLEQQLNKYKQIVAEHDKRRTTYPLQTGATYDYNTDRGQSQYTVSLQMQEQNVDQRENEAEELRALERDIVGLNEVFKDVAVMVNEQQEVINTIENNVEQASSRVERGNIQLSRAVEQIKSNRKLKCCLITTCLIILAIIILAIVISVAVTQSK